MDLLDPFSCQLHHIAFDRLKSHTLLPCLGTQSINITLKFHCVFFILNFTIANTVISKKSYFRPNIWDVIYVQREQQGTTNGALGDTRQNRSPVRFYTIYNNSLLSEAKKRIYPFQCLATDCQHCCAPTSQYLARQAPGCMNIRHFTTHSLFRLSEPHHDKTNKMTCAASEDSDPPSVTHRAPSEDSDQSGGCPGWSRVFAGRTRHFVCFVMMWLKCLF